MPSSARAAPRAVIASRSDAAPVALRLTADGAEPGSSRGRRRDLALAGAPEFDRCLARPPLVKSGAFALHLFWRSLLDEDAAVDAGASWRLGLVIPKRYEASAVARNTIKRRFRDAFRRGRVAWAVEFGSADLVVRMHGPLVTRAEAAARTAPLPARVRAQGERCAPNDAFAALVERLRSRKAPRAGARAAPAEARS